MAHTPAPWKAVDVRNQKNGQIRIFQNGHVDLIANVMASNLNCEANATLIAAAPDMYTELCKLSEWLKRNAGALEEAAKSHARFPSVADDELANAKNYRATAKHIDAVTAKAEGR